MEFLAYLISDLYHAGVDVHILQPHYRRLMKATPLPPCNRVCADLPASRVHLAQDRVFYYADALESNADWLNLCIAIAFQREVLHRWIPEIEPDLLQCHDWMCGLLSAAAETLDLPCIFSLGWTETRCVSLQMVEDIGLDTAMFWNRLYFSDIPTDYPQVRYATCADLLLSGVHAATIINAGGTDLLLGLARSLGGDGASPLRSLLRSTIRTQRMTCICEKSLSTEDYMALYDQTIEYSRAAGREPFSRHQPSGGRRQAATGVVAGARQPAAIHQGRAMGRLVDFRPLVFEQHVNVA